MSCCSVLHLSDIILLLVGLPVSVQVANSVLLLNASLCECFDQKVTPVTCQCKY